MGALTPARKSAYGRAMIRFGVLFLCLIALSGCVTAAAGGYIVAQDRPIEDGVSDITAAQGLRNTLTRRDMDANANDFAGVRVRVVEGLALLLGTVPTEGIRAEVETIARSQPRIKTVVNELKISPTYGGSVTDKWVGTKARTALASATGVRSINFAIEVEEGVIYLMGRARSLAELGLAAEAVARVSGVENVVSLVAVVEAAPVSQ